MPRRALRSLVHRRSPLGLGRRGLPGRRCLRRAVFICRLLRRLLVVRLPRRALRSLVHRRSPLGLGRRGLPGRLLIARLPRRVGGILRLRILRLRILRPGVLRLRVLGLGVLRPGISRLGVALPLPAAAPPLGGRDVHRALLPGLVAPGAGRRVFPRRIALLRGAAGRILPRRVHAALRRCGRGRLRSFSAGGPGSRDIHRLLPLRGIGRALRRAPALPPGGRDVHRALLPGLIAPGAGRRVFPRRIALLRGAAGRILPRRVHAALRRCRRGRLRPFSAGGTGSRDTHRLLPLRGIGRALRRAPALPPGGRDVHRALRPGLVAPGAGRRVFPRRIALLRGAAGRILPRRVHAALRRCGRGRLRPFSAGGPGSRDIHRLLPLRGIGCALRRAPALPPLGGRDVQFDFLPRFKAPGVSLGALRLRRAAGVLAPVIHRALPLRHVPVALGLPRLFRGILPLGFILGLGTAHGEAALPLGTVPLLRAGPLPALRSSAALAAGPGPPLLPGRRTVQTVSASGSRVFPPGDPVLFVPGSGARKGTVLPGVAAGILGSLLTFALLPVFFFGRILCFRRVPTVVALMFGHVRAVHMVVFGTRLIRVSAATAACAAAPGRRGLLVQAGTAAGVVHLPGPSAAAGTFVQARTLPDVGHAAAGLRTAVPLGVLRLEALVGPIRDGRRLLRRAGLSVARAAPLLVIRVVPGAAGILLRRLGAFLVVAGTAAAAAGEVFGVLGVAFLVFLDGLVLGDLVLDRLLPAGLSLAGAQLAPPVAHGLKGPLGQIGDGTEGKTGDAGGHTQSAAGCAGGLVDHPAGRAAHIAGADGLHARLICQDAGHQAARLLRRLGAAVDQHDLGDGVEHRPVLEQDQLRAGHDGQIDEHQLHGDHRAEHAQGLDGEGCGPLAELAAVVQRRGGDEGRRDDVQQQEVEDAGHAVEDDDHQVEDQGDGGEPHQKVVRLEADVEIVVYLVVVVDAPPVLVEIGAAESVVKGGMLIERGVLRRAEGAQEEDHAVQVDPLVHNVVDFRLAHGPGGGIGLEVVHGSGDAAGDALMVDVDAHVLPQVRALGDLAQHRLPGFLLCPVLRIVVGIVEDALLLEEIHVSADIVEAEVEVIAVVAVGNHGIVADGGQHPAHGGIFLFRELPLLGLVQMVGVVEDIVDLAHEDARGAQHHAYHQGEADDQEEAADGGPDDLTQGLLLLTFQIEHLAYDRPDREHENQDHADDRHAPVDVVDGLVGEEDVDQVVLLPVVGDGLQPGKDLEQVHQDADEPAEAPLDIVAELEDGGVEDAFQQRAQTVAQKIAYTAPEVFQHIRSLPPFPSVFHCRSYPIFSRFRRTMM